MITTKEFLANSKAKNRNSADIVFDNITPRYDLAQKKLTFTAVAQGSRGDHYNVRIAFFDIDPDGLTPDELSSGAFPKPNDLLDKPIKVDCDCKDYTFGGALKGNLKQGAALYTDAELTHYVKKTDRPENNPENIAYGCKHIVSFITQIMDAMSE